MLVVVSDHVGGKAVSGLSRIAGPKAFCRVEKV
jgi:hypothetical protein